MPHPADEIDYDFEINRLTFKLQKAEEKIQQLREINDRLQDCIGKIEYALEQKDKKGT